MEVPPKATELLLDGWAGLSYQLEFSQPNTGKQRRYWLLRSDTVRLHDGAREEIAAVDQVARIITFTLEIEEVHEQYATQVKRLVEFDRISIHIITHRVWSLAGFAERQIITCAP